MGRFAVWFDIPVADMGRAIAFYEHVTKQKLQRMQVGPDRETALFESDGCLFRSPEDEPSHFGSRIYFDATPSVDEWLGRVEAAGGKVLVPRSAIGGGRGFFAYFEDSEGNRIGLHGRT
jgi:uncharacterized protein